MRAFIISTASICYAWTAFAGIGTGGSNPPAQQESLEMLMSNPAFDVGLYRTEAGGLGVAGRRPLSPETSIARAGLLRIQGLRMSSLEFDILRLQTGPLEAKIELGGNLSFEVQSADVDEEALVLKDRRLIMRERTNRSN